MELLAKRKEIVGMLIKQNILVGKDIIHQLRQEEIVDKWYEELKNGTLYDQLATKQENTDKEEQEESDHTKPNVTVIKNIVKESTKKSIQDFVAHFTNRYKQLNKILQTRSELQNLTSISRTLGKQDREKVSVIAYVTDKQKTKNDNIILTIEDDTGVTKAIASKSKQDVIGLAKDLTFDEVIGITGTSGDKVIFIDNIILPDIPLTHEFKKSDEDVNVAILSDLHIGSDLFMAKEFHSFIKWIRGETGNAIQRQQAKMTKYIIIAGDLVDGVGIYPAQEKELTIPDIYKQYEKVAEFLRQIPQDKIIIIIPGNHDIGRLAEPQPPLSEEYAAPVIELPNVISLSNPSMIRIHTTKNTPGFDFLIYHGYSYDFYGDTVEGIRSSAKNISERVGPIMQYLLQRRHLAPTHKSSLYVPDKQEDTLVIDRVPDFFVSGHIHKVAMSHYRGVSLICGSCWQAKTPFQEKVGHEPEPCKVPIINLKTRNTTLMDFNEQNS